MVVVLAVLLSVAVIATLVLLAQVGPAKVAGAKAQRELEGLRARLPGVEAEAKKNSDALETKRREVEELKERLRGTKKRRYEEREAAKASSQIEQVRADFELEFERKLGKAREDAEEARAKLERLTAENEALRARKAAPAEPKVVAVAAAKQPEARSAAEARPAQPREASPEEKARAENAEKALAKAQQKIEQLDAEMKKARGRSETDRRVFVVQKSELELAKDRFRALETKFSALTLERDDLRKALFLLEKELKGLTATGEPATPQQAAPVKAQGEAGAGDKAAEAAPAATNQPEA